MKTNLGKYTLFALGALAVIALCFETAQAQRQRRNRGFGGFGGGRRSYYSNENLPPRDIFPGNVYTFARVIYDEGYYGGFRWDTDYPDSDINFMMRLSEITTIEVAKDEDWITWDNPMGVVHHTLRLTDDDLWNYPILYLIEPGSLEFTELEAERLREYLLRGGFLHVDDFWGTQEWLNFEYEMNKVLPQEEFGDFFDFSTVMDHPIFHIVFEITEIPQIPSISSWRRGRISERGYDSAVPHMYGIHDHDDRLMVVITHNTDLGDGWEREGENIEYFREFSVKKAYPLGINIVVYAMTH